MIFSFSVTKVNWNYAYFYDYDNYFGGKVRLIIIIIYFNIGGNTDKYKTQYRQV